MMGLTEEQELKELRIAYMALSAQVNTLIKANYEAERKRAQAITALDNAIISISNAGREISMSYDGTTRNKLLRVNDTLTEDLRIARAKCD